MTQADQPNGPDRAVAQAGLASDYARQALLGSGVQNVYFGEPGQAAEAAISLAPPFGLRDDRLPVRGRDAIRLGGLPLALKIAGSYLAQSASIPAAFSDPGTIGTYRDYLEAIDTTPSTDQLTPDQALTLIGQTWDLTLRRLDAQSLPEARRLLRLLACFADAPIPYEPLLHPATSRKLRSSLGSPDPGSGRC